MPMLRCLAALPPHFFRGDWGFRLLLPFMVWTFSIVAFRMGSHQDGAGQLP